MKNGKHTLKLPKQKPAPQTQRQHVKTAAKPMLPRWAILTLCLLLSCGGSWALFEFVIVSRLPPELVGKWEVSEGKHRGAVFDFSRRGTLEAHFDSSDPNMMNVVQADVAVQDERLLVTTQNPNTRRYETRVCAIRELTANSLIVEFEKGDVFKMVRVR
jgi:hypothetical protein